MASIAFANCDAVTISIDLEFNNSVLFGYDSK